LNAAILLSLALAVGQSPATADSDSKAAIKKLAQEIGDATVKGDFAAVFDHTYPPVVEKFGGRAKAIEFTESSLKKMKSQGFALKRFEIGEPGEFFVEGDNVFVVVPTKIEMIFSAGTIRSKSYLLGISSDGKKTWSFVDGAGLRSEEARKAVLPKMPDKLKLPELAKPEIIKDK
jgi:hypothetical protein